MDYTKTIAELNALETECLIGTMERHDIGAKLHVLIRDLIIEHEMEVAGMADGYNS